MTVKIGGHDHRQSEHRLSMTSLAGAFCAPCHHWTDRQFRSFPWGRARQNVV